MGRFLKTNLFIFAFIILNIFLSAYWLLIGDIRFDVDISRDFLLIEEMVTIKPFTLIGSHTSIGGVFHGPLWYYLNLPAFFLFKGDPLLIGWFWWGLSIVALVMIYSVTQKLFNRQTAVLAILLYSANAIINPVYGLKMFFPPYGAVVLFPVFFYLFVKYIFNKNPKFLILALLTLGAVIQFEMAFGVPILGLTLMFLIYFYYKNRLIRHTIFLPVILLPLSTFILFDLKHDFLQSASLVRYFQLQLQKSDFDLVLVITEKVKGILSDTFFLLTQDNRALSWIYSILFVVLTFKVKIPTETKKIYLIFIYFYFGYWLVHLSFKPLWSSYYWPLLPVIIMLFVGFKNFLPKKIFLLIFLPLLFWNMYIGISYIKATKIEVSQRDKNSWAFNKYVAETVYRDAKADFGYFIFTPERWIYQQWYALKFMQRQYPEITTYPFAKQKLTYLLLVDTPENVEDPISIGWRITDLKINQDPKEKQRVNIVEIQKYHLTEDEIKSGVNPYLLNSTFFR
jgi:hypothetical protein